MNTGHLAARDKAAVRAELDLREATWQRLRPEGDTLEYAFVTHSDNLTYVALRQSSEPDGTTLVFTPSEWDAFLAGVRDGEFDRPR
ncbi:protein of unknown function (DUF397) [Saccharomonospora marina XMU15]|uniref:DUF397 domain-containing protein n=1 Tax=Saccharomonospora marina XMU15 TaxID=882083 RepID=H5WYF9_9PSEU|nr:DUF397 domain-containing protein [Saccharomonospora marina]EHR49550.1 protein of unknown function (DUF397) [Saccharomonospora marina XMU15]